MARRRFAYRVLRFPLRVLWAGLTLRPLRLLAQTCYAYGYAREWLRPSPGLPPGPRASGSEDLPRAGGSGPDGG